MATSALSQTLYLAPKEYESSHLELVENHKEQDLSVLRYFQSHSLLEQNRAALMNRVDDKFLLPMTLFKPFMTELSKDYSILSAYGMKAFNYQTTYFDDKDKQFYHDHHNGKLNRYKVRFRRYVESDNGFLEIKFKNNKKRTIKERIPMDCTLPNQSRVNEFVNRLLGYSKKLETNLFVNYKRITLLNKSQLERITIDLNLSFSNAINQCQSIQDKVFIVEIKQEGKTILTPCYRFLKKRQFRALNFSKYCIGTALTQGQTLSNNKQSSMYVKHNRFKPVLRQLGKFNARY